jgi:uncharacterized RDD family membrane protein YckC
MIYDLQKASFWKRASAFLFDLVIMIVVVVGIASLMSMAMKYELHYNNMEHERDIEKQKIEAEYGCELDLSVGYSQMTEQQKEMYEKLDNAISENDTFQAAALLLLNYSLVICLVSTFAAYAILEFAVPMIFGNGQTLGKKLFSIGVIRTNTVKAKPFVLFVRMLFGKYTIETVLPLFVVIMMFFGFIGIVGPVVLLGLLLLEVIAMLVTRTRSALHDLIADCCVVDMTTQMVFESEQALLDYKKKIHEENVANSPY